MAIFRGTGGASDATDQATNQAVIAAQYASAAAVSATNAQTVYTNFNNTYLGAKATAPTVDNSGLSLNAGDLYYDTTLTKLQVYTGTGWVDVATATPSSFSSNIFSGNGVQTSFTISNAPASIQSLMVFVGGAKLRPTLDYTTSGTSLNFIVAPASGTNNISVLNIFTLAVGVPNDDTVSTIKIQNGAVTDSKIALGIAGNKIANIPSGNLSATTVDAALNELQSDIDTRATSSSVTTSLSGKVDKTSSTGSQVTPSGTSAQRDGTPAFGYARGNTDLVRMEWWNGTAWTAMGGGATGGGVDTAFVENDTLITTNYTLGQGALISGVTVVAATDIFTLTAHGFVAGQLVQFSSTTALPAPLLAQTGYYVIATNLTANTFMVSTTQGGATVDITTTGTGTHSVGKLKNAISAGAITIADGVTVNIPTNASWSIV